MAGAGAVPVPPSHPDAAIEYMIRDSRPEVVLCDEAHVERMRGLHPRVLCMPPRGGFRFLSTPHLLGGAIDALGRSEQRWHDEDYALILYTSGTTGRYAPCHLSERRSRSDSPSHPLRASLVLIHILIHTYSLSVIHFQAQRRGPFARCVGFDDESLSNRVTRLTFARSRRPSPGSLAAQVHSLSKAWKLSERDRVLHCLPLHHIHGVVNALLLPLYVGGSVDALPRFSVRGVFDALHERRSTVFMGVPTMYSYLAKHVANLESKVERMVAVEAIRSQSLWICGSSAMPLPLIQQWKALSGSYPLERYGMTETGMILGTDRGRGGRRGRRGRGGEGGGGEGRRARSTPPVECIDTSLRHPCTRASTRRSLASL